MSMEGYEIRRENLWKSAYKDDPAFSHGESPVAKVLSYFCKRNKGVEVDITKTTIPTIDFDIIIDVSWVKFHMDRTIKYKRKWNSYEEYKFIALSNYIDQCISGEYSKCLLSKQEYMSIKPKKK